jgi:3-hydroxyisobutyrate dehydrogenase-like beta-hydroxyacid dehydrogenase
MSEASAVAVLVLGGMGSALASALLSRGHAVTVWNRSGDRAKPLVANGAKLAVSAAEAITSSPLVIMCVLDYEVANDILNQPGVADALNDRTFVQLSTGLPEQVYAQQALVKRHGGRFIAGGIVAYPRSIGRPSALIVYGGDSSFERHRETLSSLGSSPYFLGPDPGKVTGAYFALSSFMIGSLGLFYETAAVARKSGIGIDDFYLMSRLSLDEVLDGIRDGAQRISTGNFKGDQASIDLHLAGMQYVADTFEATGVPTRMTHGLVDMLKLAVESGDGAKDVSHLTETFWARRRS